MSRSKTLPIVLLVVTLAGVGMLLYALGPVPATPPTPPAGPATAVPVASGSTGQDGLYRPPHRTDKASVVGQTAPVDSRGMTPEELAKLAALEPDTPHPVAIQAGEDEKDRRRAESQARREARAAGEDPGPRDRSDSGPGERVGETQAVLDAAENGTNEP